MRISQYPGALEDILEEWLALAEIVCDNDTVISKLLERMLVTNHKERLDFIELNELLQDEERQEQEELSLSLSRKQATMMLDLKECQAEEQNQLAQSKFMTHTKSGFLCLPSATKKPKREFFKASNSKLSGSTVVKNSNNIFTKQNFLVGKPSDSMSPQRKFSLKPTNQAAGVPAILANRKGSILTIPGSSRTLEHLQTQQAWSPSSSKVVHKKAQTLAQIKLAPIDVRSLQSTKSTLFDSPMKKCGSQGFLQLNTVQVIRRVQQMKDLLEKVEEGHCAFNGDLIVFGDDETIVLDVVRLTEAASLSFILTSDNKEALKGFVDKIGHFQSMQSLELNLTQCAFSGTEGSRKLPIQILKLKRLTSLELILNACDGDTGSFLKNWVNVLLNSTVVHLAIRLLCPTELGFLVNCSQSMQKLQTLDLSFSGMKIDEASHKMLFDQTSRLPSLTQLVISFFNCEILSLKQTKTRWTLNPKLTCLSLSYDETPLLESFSLLILSFEPMLNLTTLKLSFRHLATTTSYLRLLFDYIRKMSSLQELAICLDDMETVDDQINHFICDKFKGLKQLNLFQLNQINTKITELSYHYFFALAQFLHDHCTPQAILYIKENLMHFEHVGPRVASRKMLEAIKEDRAPIGFLMKITHVNVENVAVHLRSFQRIQQKIDQAAIQLVLPSSDLNYVAGTNQQMLHGRQPEFWNLLMP